MVDAALAGFIQSYADLLRQGQGGRGTSLVSDDTTAVFRSNILDFVERVSESEGATPGSVISFEEQVHEQSRLAKLWRLTKIAFDVLPVFRYVLSIAALIIALWLVDLALDVVRYSATTSSDRQTLVAPDPAPLGDAGIAADRSYPAS